MYVTCFVQLLLHVVLLLFLLRRLCFCIVSACGWFVCVPAEVLKKWMTFHEILIRIGQGDKKQWITFWGDDLRPIQGENFN